MRSLLLSLDYFDAYLRGKSPKYLKKYMEIYDDRVEIADRDFHRIRFVDASEAVKKRILSILRNLNISEEKRKHFHQGMTVYEILEQLAQQGHSQINYLLDLIDEKLRPSKWLLGLGAGILVSFLIYLLTLPTFQFVVNGINNLLISVTGIPIIGLVYTIIVSLYYFFNTLLENRETRSNRWRDVLFLTMSTAGNISAYAILIATAAATNIVVAGLFVAAVGVDVAKEAFCLLQEYFQYHSSPRIDADNKLTIKRAKARHVFGFEKRRNALFINLGAALLIAGITAVWCFLPPGGLLVTAAAFTAIGIVYLVKHLLLKWNEERLRDKLQHKLIKVEKRYINKHDSPEDNPELAEEFQCKAAAPYSPNRVPEPTSENRSAIRPTSRSRNLSVDTRRKWDLRISKQSSDLPASPQSKDSPSTRRKTSSTTRRRLDFFSQSGDGQNAIKTPQSPVKRTGQKLDNKSPRFLTPTPRGPNLSADLPVGSSTSTPRRLSE